MGLDLTPPVPGSTVPNSIDPQAARHRWTPRGVLPALALLLGACSSAAPPATFDLRAPTGIARVAGRGQIVVAEPAALQSYDADRIIVRSSDGTISSLGGGQWSDRLPRLIQARLVQTFENAGRVGSVARPGDRLLATAQLTSEIRAFELRSETGEALVEMSVRLVNDRLGTVIAARIVTARAPVAALDAPNAARALDEALSRAMVEIVRWASTHA